MSEELLNKIIKRAYIMTMSILTILIIFEFNIKLYGGITIILHALFNTIIYIIWIIRIN